MAEIIIGITLLGILLIGLFIDGYIHMGRNMWGGYEEEE